MTGRVQAVELAQSKIREMLSMLREDVSLMLSVRIQSESSCLVSHPDRRKPCAARTIQSFTLL